MRSFPCKAAHLRLVTIPLAGGPVVKDPIYDYLKQRDDFSAWLHERPLYVTGRSLRLENEPLYQKAFKLYKTRNKLVHRGIVPESGTNDYYRLEDEDVMEALATAAEVVQWFGSGKDYKVPVDDWLGFGLGQR